MGISKVGAAIILLCATSVEAAGWVGKIKTKGGSIVSNVVVQAKNQTEAETKIERRYRGCKVLSLQAK